MAAATARFYLITSEDGLGKDENSRMFKDGLSKVAVRIYLRCREVREAEVKVESGWAFHMVESQSLVNLA